MIDFLNLIFSGANAIPTGLLLFTILYWIIVILGVVGTDFLDIDIDIDAEGDMDMDGTASADISWLNKVLLFFNLGKIPFMIWLTFVTFPLWFICVNVNGMLGISNFLLGLVVLLPTLIASLFLAKFLTWPFAKFFAKIDEDSKEKEIIGKVGTVTLSADHIRKGQAEIDYRGSFLSFYIKTRKDVSVEKGERVLFIKDVNDEGYYLIEPYQEIT